MKVQATENNTLDNSGQRPTSNGMRIGFIGQGYIGKNYADDFENRGFLVVRYALEEPYKENKEKIKESDIFFIAVPTPTTPRGFDVSTVEEALKIVPNGKIAIIKSTISPGTTKRLQRLYNNLTILNSPEFLSQATAAYDAANPFSNIIGIPEQSEVHKKAAELVLSVLPKATFELICDSDEAEIIKYTHNGSGYVQIVFFNIMYDLAKTMGHDWANIEQAVKADPLISSRYSKPIHKSGRGAGGHCFIKDFAVLSEVYADKHPNDKLGIELLSALVSKNNELLRTSGKDVALLEGVYGEAK